MTEPVHSISILMGLLLIGTAYVIYKVIRYDDEH